MKFLIGMWMVIASLMAAAVMFCWAGVDPDWLRVFAMFGPQALFIGTIVTLFAWYVRRREHKAVAGYVASTKSHRA